MVKSEQQMDNLAKRSELALLADQWKAIAEHERDSKLSFRRRAVEGIDWLLDSLRTAEAERDEARSIILSARVWEEESDMGGLLGLREILEGRHE